MKLMPHLEKDYNCGNIEMCTKSFTKFLNNYNIQIGEKYLFETDIPDGPYYRLGIRVSKDFMIPIGLASKNKEAFIDNYYKSEKLRPRSIC